MVDKLSKFRIAITGSLISYLFGGWSAVLEVLLIFVIFDYVTGIIGAGVEGSLSSAVGLRGIGRKVGIFVLVAAAHLVDRVLGNAHLFRDTTIFFYLANELLSIIENIGRIGLPIPPAIGQAVEVLRGRGTGRTEKEKE